MPRWGVYMRACVPSLSSLGACTRASPQQWPHCGCVEHCCSGLGAACCGCCQHLCLGFVPGMMLLCSKGGGSLLNMPPGLLLQRGEAMKGWPLAVWKLCGHSDLCWWSGLSLTAVVCENCLQNKACFGF